MQRDPENLFELSADLPDLDGVPLLHHLEGFMDAGAAGRCWPSTWPPPASRPRWPRSMWTG